MLLARALRREDAIVKLNSRAFDVLLYLVQNPGRLLTRDELLKNVWQDAFVDESSLPQSISLLRRALEEKPGDNSYIVTRAGARVSVCIGSAGGGLRGRKYSPRGGNRRPEQLQRAHFSEAHGRDKRRYY
jgi:hypothetical protein